MAKVNFITNDPVAIGGPPMAAIAPPVLPAGATVAITPAAPVGLFPPRTANFNFWQLKGAMAHGLRAFATFNGAPLAHWQSGSVSLPALTDAGVDLNAFYNRASFQFFHQVVAGVTVFSCESEDVAVHELGHGLLDAIRPQIFSASFTEAGAIHEAMGDIFALLSSLQNPAVRSKVLALDPALAGHQFLDRLAEELGHAIGVAFGASNVEPGALRRALNTFQWKDPTTLPASAPAASLSREVHNFSRVFTGCVYDTLRNIYNAGAHTSANLLAASTIVGKLIVAAFKTAPLVPRFFQSVGQRMVQSDATSNAGAHVAAIRLAFKAHNIPLSAPAASVPVPMAATGRAAAMSELRTAMGVSGHVAMEIGDVVDSEMHEGLAHVTASVPVELKGALKGFQMMVTASARVERKGAAIMGMVGDVTPVSDEAVKDTQKFAEGLAANGQIEGIKGGGSGEHGPASHRVRKVGGQKRIERVGFACRCCR